jgi:hypothetical protein
VTHAQCVGPVCAHGYKRMRDERRGERGIEGRKEKRESEE